jgi:hypothetical protein
MGRLINGCIAPRAALPLPSKRALPARRCCGCFRASRGDGALGQALTLNSGGRALQAISHAVPGSAGRYLLDPDFGHTQGVEFAQYRKELVGCCGRVA